MRKRDLKPGKEIDMPDIVVGIIESKMKTVGLLMNTIVRLSERATAIQQECSEMINVILPPLEDWDYDFNPKRKKIFLKRKKT